MYETDTELEAFFKSLYHFRFERRLGEGAFGLAVLAFDETEEIFKVFKLPKTQETTEALQIEGAKPARQTQGPGHHGRLPAAVLWQQDVRLPVPGLFPIEQ